MKPKPFWSLNHFTVPLATVLTSSKKSSSAPTSQPTTLLEDLLPWHETNLRTDWTATVGNLPLTDCLVKVQNGRGSDIGTQGPEVQQPRGLFLRVPGAEVPSAGW